MTFDSISPPYVLLDSWNMDVTPYVLASMDIFKRLDVEMSMTHQHSSFIIIFNISVIAYKNACLYIYIYTPSFCPFPVLTLYNFAYIYFYIVYISSQLCIAIRKLFLSDTALV